MALNTFSGSECCRASEAVKVVLPVSSVERCRQSRFLGDTSRRLLLQLKSTGKVCTRARGYINKVRATRRKDPPLLERWPHPKYPCFCVEPPKEEIPSEPILTRSEPRGHPGSKTPPSTPGRLFSLVLERRLLNGSRLFSVRLLGVLAMPHATNTVRV